MENWKKNGFKSEKEYNDFLDQKSKALRDMIILIQGYLGLQTEFSIYQ